MVVAVTGGYVVGQGCFGLPDPLMFKGDGFVVCCYVSELVVFVVGIAVGFAFRACEGLFVAVCIVAVAVCFGDGAKGDGFLCFPVKLVVGYAAADTGACVGDQVADRVIAVGVFCVVATCCFCEAACLVVAVGCGVVVGIGCCFEQSVGMVAVCQVLPQGTGFFGLSSSQVVAEAGAVAFGVSDAAQVAQGIVAQLGDPSCCVDAADGAAVFVVAKAGAVVVGIGDTAYLTQSGAQQLGAVTQGINDLYRFAVSVVAVAAVVAQGVGDGCGAWSALAAVWAGRACVAVAGYIAQRVSDGLQSA